MKYILCIVFLVLQLGCYTTKQEAIINKKLQKDKSAALTQKNIKKNVILSKKEEPYNSNIHKIIDNLPSQFYISGKTNISPSNSYSFDINTQLKETAKLILYKVETPLVFTNEIVSVDNPIISDAILISLSKTLIKSGREHLISYDYSNQKNYISLGEYSVIAEKDSIIAGSQNGWIKHTVQMNENFKPGMYLLEVRIGPQAAYLVIIVNDIQHVTHPFGEKTLIWLTDKKGNVLANIPLFYKDKEGSSQKTITNKEGIAIIPNYSPWTLAWKNSKVAIITNQQIKKNTQSNLWLDKETYLPGEVIYVAWSQISSQSTIEIGNSKGNIYKEKIKLSNSTEIVLPQDVIPGEYKVRIGNAMQTIKIQNSIAFPKPKREIITDRYIYNTNDPIIVKLYGFQDKNIDIELHDDRGKIIDVQEQENHNAISTFYLQIKATGKYKIKSKNVEKEIFIINKDTSINETIPEKLFFDDNKINIFLPHSEKSTLSILDGHKPLYRVSSSSFIGNREEFFLKQSGKWSFHTFIPSKQQEKFNFYVNAPIKIKLPEQVYSNDSTTIITESNSIDKYRYLLWATNELYHLEKNKTTWPKHLAISDSRNIPFIYNIWVRKKVTQDYAEALVSFGKKQYATSVYLCQRILKWIPQHQNAKKILEKSIHQMQGTTTTTFLSPEDRLKYTYIGGMSRTMTFEQLIAKIEEEANVYIEIDPAVYQKYPPKTFLVEGLPSGENALSLLRYFFATRSLTYKIQNGVFFITLRSNNLGDILAELDIKIDKELFDKEKTLQEQSIKTYAENPVFKTAFWSHWKQKKEKYKISFPFSGMWNIHGIAIDQKNNNYFFEQQIWIAEKH